MLALLAGCAGDPRVGQYQAAQALADAQVTAGGQIDAARAASLDRVQAAHPGDNAALEAEAARWEPVGAALDSLRDSIVLWLSAIALGSNGGLDSLADVVANAMSLYAHVVDLAAGLGVTLPRLP